MAEVVYYVAASVDGFIADAEGGVGWLTPFQRAGEDYGYAEFYASVGALLIGSRTYEQSLGFGEWMAPDRPSWVFSSRDLPAARPGVITVTRATPREVLAELDAARIERAWLLGGTRLATSFREGGLITEYYLSVMPVILGGGVPLFESPGGGARLRLAESKSYPGGVVQSRYRTD